MTTIRAQFDGRVFIPQQPVLLPPGKIVDIEVTPVADPSRRPLADLGRLAGTFPDDPNWPRDGAAEVDQQLYGQPKNGS